MTKGEEFFAVHKSIKEYVAESDISSKIISLLLVSPFIENIRKEAESTGIFKVLIYGLNDISADFIENVFIKMDSLIKSDTINFVKKIFIEKITGKPSIVFEIDNSRIKRGDISSDILNKLPLIYQQLSNENPTRIKKYINEHLDLPSLRIKGDFQKISGIVNEFPPSINEIIAGRLISEIKLTLPAKQCATDNKFHSLITSVDIRKFEEEDKKEEKAREKNDLEIWNYSFHLIGNSDDYNLGEFFKNLEKAAKEISWKYHISMETSRTLCLKTSFFTLIPYKKLVESTRYFTENPVNFSDGMLSEDMQNKFHPETLGAVVSLLLSPNSLIKQKNSLFYIKSHLVKTILAERAIYFVDKLFSPTKILVNFIEKSQEFKKDRESAKKLLKIRRELMRNINNIERTLNSNRAFNREEILDLMLKIANICVDVSEKYQIKSITDDCKKMKLNIEKKREELLQKTFLFHYKVDGRKFTYFINDIKNQFREIVENKLWQESDIGKKHQELKDTIKNLRIKNLNINLYTQIDEELINLLNRLVVQKS